MKYLKNLLTVLSSVALILVLLACLVAAIPFALVACAAVIVTVPFAFIGVIAYGALEGALGIHQPPKAG